MSDSTVTNNVTSLRHIHHIRPEYLDKAPSLSKLHDHLSVILGSLKAADGSSEVDGPVLIGHGIQNDLFALKLPFQVNYIDTTNMRFMSSQKGKIQSLKQLAEEHLGLQIQHVQSDSCEQHSSQLSADQ